jgi:hypothetical protein
MTRLTRTLSGLLALCVATTVACDSDTTGTGGSGSGGGGGGGGDAEVQAVDILFVIDNSRSMGDKQEVLAASIDTLVSALVNPPDGGAFEPVTDVHIGVISTSLGGHGADACNAEVEPMENDRGRLLDRGNTGFVATHDDLGFLAWDPLQAATPAGVDDEATLDDRLAQLITGSGQYGCGYEATHESWYRFLVDPNPLDEISVVNNGAVLKGTDDVVLWQRASFLRPNSVLAIVVLSDENDCSMRDGGQNYFAAQLSSDGEPYHLPKPRAACAVDPDDACCRSCGQAPAAGCDDSQDDCAGALTTLDDHVNLRCFDQKRRFGIDFLYPIQRYVDALTDKEIADRDGNIRPNPLFTDLDPLDDHDLARGPEHIVLATIVGVPWQDIARESDGEPDLKVGYQNAEELETNNTWMLILGDPSKYHTDTSALPQDPLMIESVDPRTGTHPITGESVAPPGSGPNANAINGHEVNRPGKDDLQYACIYDLPIPRDCANPTTASCSCGDTTNAGPLCQDDDGNFTTTQYRAPAHPGIRHLSLVRALAERGVLGSVCPAQLDDAEAADYAYVASMRAIVRAMSPSLHR